MLATVLRAAVLAGILSASWTADAGAGDYGLPSSDSGQMLLAAHQREYRDYFRADDDRSFARPFGPPPLFRTVSGTTEAWPAADMTSESSYADNEVDAAAGTGGSCCPDNNCGTCRDDCCGGWDGCCHGCRHSGRLFGLIAPSDQCFNNFVSPISNPLFMEDPRTLTELKPIFIEHSVPRSNPVLQGGDIQVWAVQFRAALTERLSIVGAKDGWINIHSPGIGDREGWANLNAGLKYNLIRDPASRFLLSAGLGYEIPLGQDRVFQGNGDGDWHFYLSGGKQLADDLYWISGSGFRIPNNHNQGSQMWYWSNSFAYQFLPGARNGTGWYAMWEINWFHWMRSGNAFNFNFEGTDLINFGSSNVAGNDIVTMFWGPKWKPTPWQEIGAGVEIPVTERRDLYRNRVYAHWIFRF